MCNMSIVKNYEASHSDEIKVGHTYSIFWSDQHILTIKYCFKFLKFDPFDCSPDLRNSKYGNLT